MFNLHCSAILDVRSPTRRMSHRSAPTKQLVEDLQIQEQMVLQHFQLNETEAGQRLLAALQKLLDDQKEANRRLQELADRQGNEVLVQQLHARSAELEEKIRQTKKQISTLKFRLLQRLARFLRLGCVNTYILMPLVNLLLQSTVVGSHVLFDALSWLF